MKFGEAGEGTTPASSHSSDPARRQVGESYKDYADRIYGMYRALLDDVGRLQELLRPVEDPCDPCGHARGSHVDGVGDCAECDCTEWWKVK